ncbi:hypothetical protein DITRI_Ditri09bG0100000 [Diplodiscus trichospermus]
MTCASSNFDIWEENAGGQGETLTGMNVQFAIDSEAPSNLTVNKRQDFSDRKAKAAVTMETKSGDESIKETYYSMLDALGFFDDDDPMEVGGNIDMKVEAAVNRETKPGDKSLKETNDSLLDALGFFDDIPKDVGRNSDMKAESKMNNKEKVPAEDMKAEAEVNKELEPGEEIKKETDYSLFDGLEQFFDDIPMDVRGEESTGEADFSLLVGFEMLGFRAWIYSGSNELTLQNPYFFC